MTEITVKPIFLLRIDVVLYLSREGFWRSWCSWRSFLASYPEDTEGTENKSTAVSYLLSLIAAFCCISFILFYFLYASPLCLQQAAGRSGIRGCTFLVCFLHVVHPSPLPRWVFLLLSTTYSVRVSHRIERALPYCWHGGAFDQQRYDKDKGNTRDREPRKYTSKDHEKDNSTSRELHFACILHVPATQERDQKHRQKNTCTGAHTKVPRTFCCMKRYNDLHRPFFYCGRVNFVFKFCIFLNGLF